MKRIVDLLRASKVPLMIYLNQKEVASSATISLNAFRDEANGYTFVTNIAKPKSLVGSKIAPVKADGFTDDAVDIASFTKDDKNFSLMRDSENNDVYIDVELGYDLANMEITSPLTGNIVTLNYIEENADDESEDEMNMDDSGEEESDDAELDEGSESDETNEGSDDLTIETVSGAEDIGGEEESEEPSEEEEEEEEEEDESFDDAEDMSEGEEEEEEEADADTVKTMDMEVSMVDMVDATKSIRLLNLNADKTEIAVFVGGTPIGQLTLGNAAETAAFLYTDGNKLFHTFKDRFKQLSATGNYSELASLGFVPYTATAKVSAIVDKYIAQEIANVRTEVAAERSTGTERHKRVVALAMVGICKGLFDQKNPLVREVANLLRQAGHLSPEIAARRALTTSAGEFTKVVFERADDLASKDDAYLNGIQDTVKSADFKAADEDTADKIGNVTTLFGGAPTSENASEGFVDSYATKKVPGRFDRIVAGLGSRRRF